MTDISLEIGLHPKLFRIVYSYISAIALVYYLHCVKPMNLETSIVLWVIVGFFVFIMIGLGDILFGT